MQTITTVGLDIAKSVFQVHGVDAGGQVVIRRQLKRRYVLAFFQKLSPCLVGIEACASSHHWSRELQVSLSRHRPIVLGDAQVVAPNARDRLHALRPRHQGPTTKSGRARSKTDSVSVFRYRERHKTISAFSMPTARSAKGSVGVVGFCRKPLRCLHHR